VVCEEEFEPPHQAVGDGLFCLLVWFWSRFFRLSRRQPNFPLSYRVLIVDFPFSNVTERRSVRLQLHDLDAVCASGTEEIQGKQTGCGLTTRADNRKIIPACHRRLVAASQQHPDRGEGNQLGRAKGWNRAIVSHSPAAMKSRHRKGANADLCVYEFYFCGFLGLSALSALIKTFSPP
jgi:hypothetical protein